MPVWRVHKAIGTVRVVLVEAATCTISECGALIFRSSVPASAVGWGGLSSIAVGKIVMAYAPGTWKTVAEESRAEAESEAGE